MLLAPKGNRSTPEKSQSEFKGERSFLFYIRAAVIRHLFDFQAEFGLPRHLERLSTFHLFHSPAPASRTSRSPAMISMTSFFFRPELVISWKHYSKGFLGPVRKENTTAGYFSVEINVCPLDYRNVREFLHHMFLSKFNS